MTLHPNNSDLWHVHFGHPSDNMVKQFVGYSSHSGNNFTICFSAKQMGDSFPLSLSTSAERFDLLHCNLWGHYKVPSTCGASYFLTTLDDFSTCVCIFLLVEKKKVAQTLKQLFAMVLTQFHKKVKVVRTDNGTKFTCLA